MYVTGPGLSTALLATALALQQRCDTTLCRVPVPAVGTTSRRPLPGEYALHVFEQGQRLHEPIRSLRDGDRTFRVLAQRQAGNAEIRRLFLHAAGVRDGSGRAARERHELHVAERLGQVNRAARAQPCEQAAFLE